MRSFLHGHPVEEDEGAARRGLQRQGPTPRTVCHALQLMCNAQSEAKQAGVTREGPRSTSLSLLRPLDYYFPQPQRAPRTVCSKKPSGQEPQGGSRLHSIKRPELSWLRFPEAAEKTRRVSMAHFSVEGVEAAWSYCQLRQALHENPSNFHGRLKIGNRRRRYV